MNKIREWLDRWGAMLYLHVGFLDFRLANEQEEVWAMVLWSLVGFYMTYHALMIRTNELEKFNKLAKTSQELLTFVEEKNELMQRRSADDRNL